MDVYVNAFYLLGDDECDDVSVLYKRLKEKAEQEATPPPTDVAAPAPIPIPDKHYTYFGPEAENFEYEKEKENKENNGEEVKEGENGEKEENEWKMIPKKVFRKNHQKNGDVEKTVDGNDGNGQENRGVERANSSDQLTGAGNGERPRNYNGKRNNGGRGKYRKVKNGEVKESKNAANGNGSSEGDAVVVESSNGEEAGEKGTTEEVNGGVPELEETEEEKKDRLEREKDDEDKRKKEEERAEEAKKMTLAEYERKILKNKQQELEQLTRKEEPTTRVVVADKDLENMKLVSKKQLPEEVLIIKGEKPKGKSVLTRKYILPHSSSEESLKKSDSSEKNDRNPVAARVAKICRYPGGVRGRDGDYGNQDNFGSKFPSRDTPRTVKLPKEENFSKDFPRLGELPTLEPTPEPSTPVVNPPVRSAGNRTAASRGNSNGPRGNRPSGNYSVSRDNPNAPHDNYSGPSGGLNGGSMGGLNEGSRGGRYVPRGGRSGGARGGRSNGGYRNSAPSSNRSATAPPVAATTTLLEIILM